MGEDEHYEYRHLTEAERAEIEKKEKEMLSRWSDNLSPEEAKAWTEAHIDDLETGMEEALQEKADFEAVMRVVQGHTNPLQALERLRKEERRTLAEAEALDAFERIKYKFLRVIMTDDPVQRKVLDLLEASETKPRAEFERMLAEADQEVLDWLKRLTDSL